jgi:hypothetical protein
MNLFNHHVTACTLALSAYIVTALPEGFSHFVTSMTAPVASGWSNLPGGACTHWKSAAFSRRTCIADLAPNAAFVCTIEPQSVSKRFRVAQRLVGSPPLP